MLRAIKQKTRIWRDVERRFAQAIIIQIHDRFLAERVPDGSKSLVPRQERGPASGSASPCDYPSAPNTPCTSPPRSLNECRAPRCCDREPYRERSHSGSSVKLCPEICHCRGAVTAHGVTRPACFPACTEAVRRLQNLPKRFHQSICLGRRADGNAKVIAPHRSLEPAHQNLSVAQ